MTVPFMCSLWNDHTGPNATSWNGTFYIEAKKKNLHSTQWYVYFDLAFYHAPLGNIIMQFLFLLDFQLVPVHCFHL